VSTLDEVYIDPQVVYNGMFTTLHHPTQGEVKNTQRPVLFDGDRAAGDMAPPMLGEHNEQVLQELGFDAVDIARIKAAGAFDR
jgi:crotonobetainyl-CoA:carnitine CoA-transferase CaiB-like acyl-CoA transferase